MMNESDPATDISVIIPVYHNPSRMSATLEHITTSPDFAGAEIIVTIDDDLDALDIASKFDGVIIDYSDVRRGKGGAILSAIEKSTRPMVGFIDVDLPIRIDALKVMYGMLGPYDVVIASRRAPQSVITSKPPLWRCIAGRVFNFMVRRMFNMGVYDTQCGAKVFKRDAVMSVLHDMHEKGWIWDLELLIRLKRKSYTIFEYPADWSQNGKSVLNFSDVKNIFSALMRMRKYLRKSQ
jgi:dolichol-phosphate mannosyltransferase